MENYIKTISLNKKITNINSYNKNIVEIDTSSRKTTHNSINNQITFINYTHQYCICIIDIVDSTKITQQLLADSNKIRSYYSIFLNTMASIINNYNGKVIKNAGDCLIYYFPKTVDIDTNKDDISRCS